MLGLDVNNNNNNNDILVLYDDNYCVMCLTKKKPTSKRWRTKEKQGNEPRGCCGRVAVRVDHLIGFCQS